MLPRVMATGPEVAAPPIEDQPDQLEPFQLRVQTAPSVPRTNIRMSPAPTAAMAGSSSTTSARAGAAASKCERAREQQHDDPAHRGQDRWRRCARYWRAKPMTKRGL